MKRLLMVFLLLFSLVQPVKADIVGLLGTSTDFSVLSSGQLNMSGSSLINGQAGAKDTFIATGDSSVTGNLIYSGAPVVLLGGSTAGGPVLNPDGINLAIADATNASITIAGLTPNQSFGRVDDWLTVSATVPGQNVVNLAGVTLSGGEQLVFQGTAPGDYFLVNVIGEFFLTGGSLVGNIPLVINLLDNNSHSIISSEINGFILSSGGQFTISHSDVIGGIFARGVIMDSGSRVDPVPLPATIFLLGSGILGLAAVGWRASKTR